MAEYIEITPRKLKSIKKSCDPSYIIGEMLETQGAHSSLKDVCKDSNCKYVAKIIPIKEEESEGKCLNLFEMIEMEFAITEAMSDAGIGAKVVDVCITPEYGIMIMEKLDGTLTDLLWEYQNDKELPIKSLMTQLEELVRRMHETGIVHRDLTPNNILYKKVDGDLQLFIADYGQAIDNNSRTMRTNDLKFLKGIKDVIGMINSDHQFADKEELMLETLSNFLGPAITLTRDGRECYDWQ